jgi:hypothetical protein
MRSMLRTLPAVMAMLLPQKTRRSPRQQVEGGPRTRALWAALRSLRTALLWAGASCALLSHLQPAAAQFDAMGSEKPIPIEAFYEVLRDYGTWVETDRYGTIFCPHPDVLGADFQPFSRGHWTMTEHGWTFVSNSKVSWVTDHYGHWVEAGLTHCSWAWLPGSNWGPAWVEWRVSDRVIAWRPKPYKGPPVRMALPQGVTLPRLAIPPELYSKDGRDAGFIAVNDNDFTARRIENVALAGSQLYAALRETEPLRDPRAGLHSAERQQIAARIEAKRAAMAANRAGEPANSGTSSPTGTPGTGSGGPADPARRIKKGSVAPGVAGLGTAGTVRTGAPAPNAPAGGLDKWNASGAKTLPPNRNSGSTGSSAGNPGEFSGAKVMEWGGPEKKPPPKKQPTPDPDDSRATPPPAPSK